MAKATEAKLSEQKPQSSHHGMYYYIKQAWKSPDEETLRNRMTDWRSPESIVKVERPLRLDKARALGYKAKKGFVIVRVRIRRGGHHRSRPNAGRRSKRMHTRKNLEMNYQWIAEQRAGRKYENLEVLNSYQIGKDGLHYFYEVILVDPAKPEIKNDKTISWIASPANKSRVFRGLTSAAKKSRGFRSKSRQLKVRPSIRAWGRLGK
ncbi:MAG: 50S ribosomal protein L15e [Candidatus Nanoarchaeia archaeon]|nr:50S ribosomal protein L15e [Candidatus Nanoarchaeia archaeon]